LSPRVYVHVGLYSHKTICRFLV